MLLYFDSISTKNKRSRKFHEVKDNADFFRTAELWTEHEHEYASVLAKHDLASTQKLFYHKRCQNFFDERHRLRQAKKNSDACMEIEEPIETNNPDSPKPSGSSTTSRRARRSSSTSYETSMDNVGCILFATDKMDSHSKLISACTMDFN